MKALIMMPEIDAMPRIDPGTRRRNRMGRPTEAMAATCEILGVRKCGGDPTIMAAAAYVASLAVGPSVSKVSRAAGLDYDFCCALAQNWRRAGFWRADGKVVIEFDPHDADKPGIASVAILMAASLGMGHLTWQRIDSPTDGPADKEQAA